MYVISNKTLYLEYDGGITKIFEVDNSLEVDGNVLIKVLDESCLYFGSSFKGRVKGSKNLLGSSYKIPVVVSEKNGVLFFPINNKFNNFWINFNLIEKYKKENGGVCVSFKGGYEKLFDVSYGIFNNQMLKCSRLWMIYLSRE